MSEAVNIETLVDSVDGLFSLPDLVIRANQLIDSETAGVEDIAELIALDPALSAQLLRLVNSAFYALPAKIETISRAITVIGSKELRSLIMSASVVEVFKDVSPQAIDMNDFWFRSVYVGLSAKQIVNDRRRAETLFLMGLMHDLGRLVLFTQLPDRANAILDEAQAGSKPLYQVEVDQLGFSSNQVSAALLKSWGLAESLYTPIEHMYHNDSGREAAILHLAARLADCAEPQIKGKNADKLSFLQQEQALLTAAGVPADKLDDLMNEVNLYCFDVLGVINPTAAMIY